MTGANDHWPERSPGVGERVLVLLLRLLRIALRIVTWPLRQVRKLRKMPLRINAYRGYGTASSVVVRGRLVDTPPLGPARGLLSRLQALFRRLSSPPVPRALVEARLRGTRAHTCTEPDGLFTLRLDGLELPERGQWEELELRAWPTRRGRPRLSRGTATRGEALIPSAGSRIGIISDIDDTVVHTGVANKLAMMWRLFATDAEARTAFPGVAELYRALHRGHRSAAENPIFYVSRGPWGIYPVLEEFFRQRRIPVGPILLLRDWGVHLTHPWPKRARDHKRALIDELLEAYPRLPFVLIGDSGQRDPEIYASATERWGKRIACSYVRDVGSSAQRREEIRALAARCAELGSEMILAPDSATIARHAAEHGFMTPGWVEVVEEVAGADEQSPSQLARSPG